MTTKPRTLVPDEVHDWLRDELFDQVPVAIAVIDRDLKIVEANAKFTEAYGEWDGRLCYEVYKGRTERCRRCGASSTFADGEVRIREERGQDRDGRPTYYIVHIVPYIRPDGSIPYVIEMSTDITSHKEMERQKLEAERLAAVGQTVAGLAHGIKNIIMGLEGGMYVVNSGIRRGNVDRALQGWRMLEEDINRISSFAKEFLEFAKGRTPHVELTDPNKVARKVIELFTSKARSEGVELVVALDEGLAQAPMDEEAIHTCLTNLALNAIDACLMSTGSDHRVVISTGESDGTLFFQVSDNGCGMDYDIKQKVFTNFFSTKAAGKGTGLGLLTTRKIVQEHGGRVSFDSTEGKGSTFRLEFPRERLPRVDADDTEETR